MMEDKKGMRKKPWPTKAAMEQVYDLKLWGSNDSPFYSGEGSHLPKFTQPYLTELYTFLQSFNKPLVVCDLGCGDFNVGKELVKYAEKYIAVDIVQDLIEHNKRNFKVNNLEFLCLDIVMDELPTGDCAILRQVLQHLSNTEIKKIVNKLSIYKYVILTEHVSIGNFESNKDIISGQGIRLKKQSGVNLLEPPFNLKVVEESTLLSVELDNNKGRVVTTMFRLK